MLITEHETCVQHCISANSNWIVLTQCREQDTLLRIKIANLKRSGVHDQKNCCCWIKFWRLPVVYENLLKAKCLKTMTKTIIYRIYFFEIVLRLLYTPPIYYNICTTELLKNYIFARHTSISNLFERQLQLILKESSKK